jgi:hypothetical protein
MKKILFTLFVIGCIAITNAQVPSYVPTNGLVGYWPFNGNANDETGNGNNGTVNGATLIPDRYENPNSAYSFDGVNDFIQAPNYSSNNSFTVSYWINMTTYDLNSLGSNDFVFVSNHSGENNSSRSFLIGYRNFGNETGFSTYIYDNTGNINTKLEGYPTNQTPPTVNVWHHLVSVFENGNYVNMYLDGQLFYENTNVPMQDNMPNLPLLFGKGVANQFGYTEGKLDDIGIWNRALTQQEVTNLYASNSSNECSTLVINTGALSTNPITYNSTVNIYPNPANDQITIDCGNIDNVDGWNIKITNMLGQEVFSQPMNTQQYVIPLNTWTGQGMYFVKIINAENEVVNIKKIVLQ